MQLQQLFNMESYRNCTCIERVDTLLWRMDSRRSDLQEFDLWLQRMERHFVYLPAAENIDSLPPYMMCRTLLDSSTNAMDDLLKEIRLFLQKQRRIGHTAPATRRQSRKLLKKHHDLVSNMYARCDPLYARVSEAVHYFWNDIRRTNAEWLIPSVSISNEKADNGDQCAVCLDNFAVKETVSQLGCAHCFHIHCMDRWIATNLENDDIGCPLCRRAFLVLP